MFTRMRAQVRHWVYAQQDVLLFAAVVALALYVIASSIETRFARRTMLQRLTVVESKVNSLCR